MAFRSKFYAGATSADIRKALNPFEFIKPDSEIQGIRNNLSNTVENEYHTEIHVPNELPVRDSTNSGQDNEHKLSVKSSS
jgi:hypothetical protein